MLNADQEGMLAKPSIESLARSVAHAEAVGLSVETVVILDRPDAITRDIVLRHLSGRFPAIETDFGDLGEGRNYAVAAAEGDYVAFLDADDF